MISTVSPSEQRERGSVMVAVIGVMAVMMIVSATVMAMTVHSLGFTSSTRAGIQSVVASESGTSVAEVALRGGTCAASYAQAITPVFSATVSYSLSATNDVWVNGCPAAGINAQRIKVVSTGSAAALGVAGNSSGDSSIVEAIYEVKLLPGIHPSGAAMYLFGGVVFKNNADLLASDGGRAAIQVKEGNMECANNTVIEGDVIVENGNLDIIACTIKGNAWASGTAKLGLITGNLAASSVNISAANLPDHVFGVYTQGAAVPTVPDWVDLAYVPESWKDADGQPFKVTAIGPDCSLTPTMLTTAANGNKPVIIDGLACPSGVSAPNGQVVLKNDLVIFANAFNFEYQVEFISQTLDEHQVWFITPDNVPDRLPTCGPGQGDFVMKNGFKINRQTVSAMLYTPCKFMAMNSFEWRGQIYANGANDFMNNTSFEYVPLGLPDVDLDTGDPMAGGSIGSDAELGSVLSVRDVASGG